MELCCSASFSLPNSQVIVTARSHPRSVCTGPGCEPQSAILHGHLRGRLLRPVLGLEETGQAPPHAQGPLPLVRQGGSPSVLCSTDAHYPSSSLWRVWSVKFNFFHDQLLLTGSSDSQVHVHVAWETCWHYYSPSSAFSIHITVCGVFVVHRCC